MAKLTNIGTDIPIEVSKGGTGVSSNTSYAVLCGGTTGTGAIQSIASVGTSGQVLTSNGAGALPTFQDAGGGAWTLISTATASSSSSIDFTGLSSTYFSYLVIINDLLPVNDANYFYMRTSSDNGTTFDSGISDYGWCVYGTKISTTAALQEDGDDLDSKIILNLYDISNAANDELQYYIQILNPSSTKYTTIIFDGISRRTGSSKYSNRGVAQRYSNSAVNAIRFFMGSGNISIGIFKLYGLSAS